MGAKAPAVLIVDDNTEFADLLGTLFTEQGLVPILAHTAHNAQVLSKLYSPAAMIVDLLLPDMTGHKLIKELTRTGGPPIFVMTGVFKGQTQMEKVKAIASIAGWYEKPFDTRVLVEQVVRLIGKQVVERAGHAKVGHVTADFDINILDPVENEGIADTAHHAKKPRSGPGQPRLQEDLEIEIEVDDMPSEDDLDIVVDDHDEDALALWDVVESATPFRTSLREESAQPAVTLRVEGPREPGPGDTLVPTGDVDQTPSVPIAWPRSNDDPGATPLTPAPVAAAFGTGTNPFQEKLKSGFSRELSPMAVEMKTGLRAKLRSGDLKPATVARLLTAFYISHETGEIVFERAHERKVIYFSEGRPVYARSNQDSDRLGAIAKKAFGLSNEQIEKALSIARQSDKMIGDVLIEEHMIEVGKRPDLVREQTRAIIRSLLTWSEGRYVIGFNVRTEIQRAELEEHPTSLVVAGIREQLDLTALRRLVPDKMQPMPSPNPPYELFELPMGDAEAMLFLRATGTRTVKTLLEEMSPRLDERDLRAFIYASLLLGMLVAGRAGKGAKAGAVKERS